MNNSKIKLGGSSVLTQVIVEKPLLLLGLDLPFIIITGMNLRNAVALSIEMFFIHFVTMLCAWYIAPKIQVWQRVFVTSTVSVIMMLISRNIVLTLIPDIETYAGIYLYLMAVNGLTLTQANFLSPTVGIKKVVRNSLLNILAFTISISAVSVFREYFGNGTIWGIPLPALVKLDGIRAPFFGFILVGFIVAVLTYGNKQLCGSYSFGDSSLYTDNPLVEVPVIPEKIQINTEEKGTEKDENQGENVFVVSEDKATIEKLVGEETGIGVAPSSTKKGQPKGDED